MDKASRIDQKDIAEKMLDFAVDVIKLTSRINEKSVERIITWQLIKSATSAGANYEEACGAESRKDFLHKLQVVLKELRESLYWLKLINKAGLVSELHCVGPSEKALELTKIIAKSIITAKSRS